MTMTKEEVTKKVIDVISEQLGKPVEEIKMDNSFIEDLGADSLDSVELIMELEETFDIEIPDSEAEEITTVGIAVERVYDAIS